MVKYVLARIPALTGKLNFVIFIFCVFEAAVENDLSYFCIDRDGVKNLVSKMIYSWYLFSLPRQMGFGSVEINLLLRILDLKGVSSRGARIKRWL